MLVRREELLEFCRIWHEAGLRVGLANGCFDCFHPGHAFLIEQARLRCDRLVVALDTDEGVRALKGPQRPLWGLQTRAATLAGRPGVDLTTSFCGRSELLELVVQMRPGVLVKGREYAGAGQEVVGRDEVLSLGGEVVLAEMLQGWSTTGRRTQ